MYISNFLIAVAIATLVAQLPEYSQATFQKHFENITVFKYTGGPPRTYSSSEQQFYPDQVPPPSSEGPKLEHLGQPQALVFNQPSLATGQINVGQPFPGPAPAQSDFGERMTLASQGHIRHTSPSESPAAQRRQDLNVAAASSYDERVRPSNLPPPQPATSTQYSYNGPAASSAPARDYDYGPSTGRETQSPSRPRPEYGYRVPQQQYHQNSRPHATRETEQYQGNYQSQPYDDYGAEGNYGSQSQDTPTGYSDPGQSTYSDQGRGNYHDQQAPPSAPPPQVSQTQQVDHGDYRQPPPSQNQAPPPPPPQSHDYQDSYERDRERERVPPPPPPSRPRYSSRPRYRNRGYSSSYSTTPSSSSYSPSSSGDYNDWDSSSEKNWLSSLFGGRAWRPPKYRGPFALSSDLSFSNLPLAVNDDSFSLLRSPSIPAPLSLRPSPWFPSPPRPMMPLASTYRPYSVPLYGGFGPRPLGPPAPGAPFSFGARPYSFVSPMMGSHSMTYPTRTPFYSPLSPMLRSPFGASPFSPLSSYLARPLGPASDLSFAESLKKANVATASPAASELRPTVVNPSTGLPIIGALGQPQPKPIISNNQIKK